MCGIFSILNNQYTFTPSFVDEQFKKGKNRGPEYSKLSQIGMKIMSGVHRIALNGANSENNQPIIDGDIVLICDGEIYNYRELYRYGNLDPKTESDCEVIIHLYRKYGIEQTLQMLDGVYCFMLLDNSLDSENLRLYVARDAYGIHPLYILHPLYDAIFDERDDRIIAFASEMKVLSEFYNQLIKPPANDKNKRKLKKIAGMDPPGPTHKYKLRHFPAGTYSSYTLSSKVCSSWKLEKEFHRYHTIGYNSIMFHLTPQYAETEMVLNIQRNLIRAIEKMCCYADRPIACLLSGGADSSIVTGLVRQFHISHHLPQMETFSIGMAGSDDLDHARTVAEYLGTKHTELVYTEQDFINIIPEVIRDIECYDTSVVRASVANYMLGKYIAQNSKAKIIFNGDGANEMCGGHLYMYMARDSIEFDKESRSLLSDTYMFDLLRADKCMGCHGLKSISPFLDRSFVQYYLSIPPQVRFHTRNDQCEKFWLRQAFINENYRTSTDRIMLPEHVLWRTTESFSDGISPKTQSWHNTVREYANKKFMGEYSSLIPTIPEGKNIYTEIAKIDPLMKNVGNHLPPTTAEQYWYRKEFEKHYSGLGEVVPYFRAPKYVDNITDPSPRELPIYNGGDNYEDLDDDDEEPTKVKPEINIEEVVRDDGNGGQTHDINVHINMK